MEFNFSRNILAYVYIAFAIAGAILPTLANIEFVQNYGGGFDISKFIELANDNPASRSLSRDLFIGAGSVTIWMFSEARRLEMKNFWIVILTTFTIAFAFAAPLFLFLRERRLIEISSMNKE